MSSSLEGQRLKDAIKALLKRGGHRYEDLAAALGVSLPTVRRFLTKDDLSIDRVAAICRWLNVSFKDLVEMAEARTASITVLSAEQEAFFAAFPHYYVYLRCLGAGLTPAAIAARFALSPQSTERYLTELEAQAVIERPPGGAPRLTVPWPANWRFPGPLAQTFGRRMFHATVDRLAEKAASPAEQASYGKDYFFMLDSLLLTPATAAEYTRDIVALYRKYNTVGRFEAKAHPLAELKTCAALLGIDQFDAMASVLGGVIELG